MQKRFRQHISSSVQFHHLSFRNFSEQTQSLFFNGGTAHRSIVRIDRYQKALIKKIPALDKATYLLLLLSEDYWWDTSQSQSASPCKEQSPLRDLLKQLILACPSNIHVPARASTLRVMAAVRDFHSKRTCLLTQASPFNESRLLRTLVLPQSSPAFAIRAIALLAHTGLPVQYPCPCACKHARVMAAVRDFHSKLFDQTPEEAALPTETC